MTCMTRCSCHTMSRKPDLPLFNTMTARALSDTALRAQGEERPLTLMLITMASNAVSAGNKQLFQLHYSWLQAHSLGATQEREMQRVLSGQVNPFAELPVGLVQGRHVYKSTGRSENGTNSGASRCSSLLTDESTAAFHGVDILKLCGLLMAVGAWCCPCK